eukprot:CAMPEP_0113627114 /NCGR_PEP_ID=MMETSP0017_2-20120614/14034_1 /TAXON_ID=2856 /ORGANISM="Cylindrotheca closterium" /LENGTH=240 /DNA_ID=CAMNT_0000537341 /DNA_START=59 /DNA_END=781 /DNA_ORIENTATION=- /assembly_acc=CAM_ASM_000147
MERYGQLRKQKSKRMSRNREDDERFQSAAAAAQNISYGEGEPVHDLPHVASGGGAGDRSSWYNDVINQGGTDELNAILQEANMAGINQDEDEVLEQYRIMAHVEASIRVKENTGFEMSEYEKKRKLHPEQNKLDYFDKSRKPKQILPDAKNMSAGGSSGMMRAEEPPLPPPRPNRRYLEQKAPLTPDLVDGVAARGLNIPFGFVSVKCLGCKTSLKVNMFGTLVRCSECSTVSPVTSSRR